MASAVVLSLANVGVFSAPQLRNARTTKNKSKTVSDFSAVGNGNTQTLSLALANGLAAIIIPMAFAFVPKELATTAARSLLGWLEDHV